jgi:homoserine O-acetyltransferase/O-succinyltransferase
MTNQMSATQVSLRHSDRRQVLRTVAMLGAAGALGKISGPPIVSAMAQTAKQADYQVFNVEPMQLQSGIMLRNAKVVYKTYGQLAADKSNVIVEPSWYSGTHTDMEPHIASDKILDPSRYFIVAINMFGSGLSTSPSNAVPPFDRKRYPKITLTDNVRIHRQLLSKVFGIQKIAVVYGFSMGGQQAYHWGALYPEQVERICVVCGSAKTSPHNFVFLEGLKAALTADPLWQDDWFASPPLRGLRAFARIYAGWGPSQEFYREGIYKSLGSPTVEDHLVAFWENHFLQWDANDLLAQLWAWQNADISVNELYGGDLAKALGSIKAKALIMPGETDLYFRVADNEGEMRYMQKAQLRVIPSLWGHLAGIPISQEDSAFLAKAVHELLSSVS